MFVNVKIILKSYYSQFDNNKNIFDDKSVAIALAEIFFVKEAGWVILTPRELFVTVSMWALEG